MANRADQRKFHYIYKITRTDGSGKYYIGMHSTDDMDDGYFGSGMLLWKSIKKHGKEKHVKEILEHCNSRIKLKAREKEIVNVECLADKKCMNLKLGGEGGGKFSSKDQQRNASIAGNKSKARDHKKVFEQRMKTHKLNGTTTGKLGSNGWIGMHHSESTKHKIGSASSIHQLGEKNSQFGSCWVTIGVKSIKIKKEQLGEYLMNGYSRGRKICR